MAVPFNRELMKGGEQLRSRGSVIMRGVMICDMDDKRCELLPALCKGRVTEVEEASSRHALDEGCWEELLSES